VGRTGGKPYRGLHVGRVCRADGDGRSYRGHQVEGVTFGLMAVGTCRTFDDPCTDRLVTAHSLSAVSLGYLFRGGYAVKLAHPESRVDSDTVNLRELS
jgi:hypothetical protein